ncbi:MAG: glycoside hydrolase family 127 protein, partial [Spirochaetaceae bacterium]|nr:glycoside hydrolase family 127 protein [Spirochaetaceae bacterium]
ERGAEPKYFDIEAAERGQEGDTGRFGERVYEYTQTHLPVREQRVAVGHAVRAVYMYSAMADLAALDGDEGLAEACRVLWEDLTRRQMFITGGIGQEEHWEGFSRDYDLPNDMTYNETCASVGLVFWAKRMAALELKGDYHDIAEKALYNGVLSGMSLDGKKYFYVNLLESDPKEIAARRDTDYAAPTRQGWFACACCPPNLARLIASLGAYQFSRDESSVAIHLYFSGKARIPVAGTSVSISVEGDYPWGERLRIRIDPASTARFILRARVPGWCDSFEASVGGELYREIGEGYLVIERNWEPGDVVELLFRMPVRRMRAHPSVRADAGKVALTR